MMAEPKLIREWETTKINPREIAEYLNGTLEKSVDAESDWNIHLNYGKKNPVITLKLDTELRRMFLVVPKPRKGCLATILVDIEKLHFTLSEFMRKEVCDILFEGSGSSIIISSYGHMHDLGSRKNRESTVAEYQKHNA